MSAVTKETICEQNSDSSAKEHELAMEKIRQFNRQLLMKLRGKLAVYSIAPQPTEHDDGSTDFYWFKMLSEKGEPTGDEAIIYAGWDPKRGEYLELGVVNPSLPEVNGWWYGKYSQHVEGYTGQVSRQQYSGNVGYLLQRARGVVTRNKVKDVLTLTEKSSLDAYSQSPTTKRKEMTGQAAYTFASNMLDRMFVGQKKIDKRR